jgi:hypothetical protein
MTNPYEALRNRQVELRGHFPLPVRIESIERIADDGGVRSSV